MLILDNASIFTENKLVKGYLVVENGKIQQISPGPFQKQPDSTQDSQELDIEIINVKGSLVLPGFIDAHVHFRDFEEQSYKETVSSGSIGALRGGVTSVITMPNTIPPLSSMENLSKYYEILEDMPLFCNIGLYTTVKSGFSLGELEGMKKSGIFGIKIYPGDASKALPLAWEGGWRSDLYPEEYVQKLPQILENFQHDYPHWHQLFDDAKKFNLPILIHPEFPREKESLKKLHEQGMIIAKNESSKNPQLFAHHVAHPVYTNELALVEMIIAFLYKFYPNPKDAPHIHFVHVSSSEVIHVIKAALKSKNYPCSIEVSPHHLLLNYEKSFETENMGKVLVPLRSPEIQKGLLEEFSQGSTDTIGTDHAPHSLEEKSKSFGEAPSGFPYIDFASRILLTEVFEKRMKLEDVVSQYSSNPANLFGLSTKGQLKVGYDADIVIVGETEPYPIHGKDMVSHQKWTPWEDYTLRADIDYVIIGGEMAYRREHNLFIPKGVPLH
ncbi:MAG: dihydroorotase [Promethearchaeota archaeon]